MSIRDIFSSLNICKNGNEPVSDPENIPISKKYFVEQCKLCLDRDTRKWNLTQYFQKIKKYNQARRVFMSYTKYKLKKKYHQTTTERTQLTRRNGKI